MNLSQLEQIVGPVNRGRLETGFPSNYEPVPDNVPSFFSESRAMAKPPPLTEDLSHLNSPSTRRFSELAKRVWKRLTPEQRRKRKEHLREAGMAGGKATKNVRHLHGT